MLNRRLNPVNRQCKCHKGWEASIYDNQPTRPSRPLRQHHNFMSAYTVDVGFNAHLA